MGTAPTAFRPAASAGLPPAAEEELCDIARDVYRASIQEWGEARAVAMIGRSAAFQKTLERLSRVLAYDEPVLITGESGAGKEAMAQAIYLLGPRRGKPFESVNCPQYQDGNLTVSELFGHRKGSFTGAVADRKGCFETAHGGVIFLDEIADLHMSAQVMLLRALAVGEFQPLGSDTRKSVNVRVVAATNRPLQKLMVAQEFRHDLFFRLRYFHLHLPALRERGDDWRLLLEHALARLHRKYGVAKRFSEASLTTLETYSWPGSIRQLLGVATMGYALAEGDLIEPQHISDQLEGSGAAPLDSMEAAYTRLISGQDDFWTAVHEPFLKRDLNRSQVRWLVKKALHDAGSYKSMLDTLRVAESQYQKFMDFLRHHGLKP